MSRIPLRVRLACAFALAMAAVLGATGLFLYVRLGTTLDEQIEQSLRARADDVTSLLRATGTALGGGAGRLAEADESFVQVIGPSGAVRNGSALLSRHPLLSADELARARRGTILTDHERVPGLPDVRARLLATPVAIGGERMVVVTGASLDDRDDALAGLLAQLLVGGPVALVLASLFGYAVAAGALRPVEAMSRRAAEISATTAGRRLPVPEAGDEIARLARTLNDMLARLEAGLERERRFVAEASHELRTPLSLLKTELELALRHPRSQAELRSAVASAAEETDRLVRLADDLLILARSDEGELRVARERLSVPELLDTVAQRFTGRAEQMGRVVEVDVARDLVLVGDRVRLEQALGDLVDNAFRYGEGGVRLAGRRNEGRVELHVVDDGGGFPADFLPIAFDRFSRADGSRFGAGAGLGLAIVEAIARAHDGTAHAVTPSDGGADVWLDLPGC